MPRVIVRLPTPLREFAQGQAELTIDVNDIADVLAKLNAQYPGVASRVMSANHQVRPYVNLFVGDSNIKNLEGMNTRLQDGDVVSIIPSVAGGASARERRLAELRANIAQVTPSEAQNLQTHGAVLIDVREAEEIASGSPPGAARLGRGYLELRIEQSAPDLAQTLVVMCDGGTRSLFAAEDLQRLGYTDVRSVTGGFSRWRTEGLPVENPQALSADARERYARHLRLPEVGEAGQRRLLTSRVLLIGAGGLGSPAALYLAAAGVGTLGLVDNDVVDRSNLQRQILHTDARVGTSKVASAQASMLALNPSLNVQTHALRLDSGNVEEVFAGYEVIVDGSDNFATRYLINDACVKLQLPNIHGAVARFEGFVSVFWPAGPKGGPCYRCIFPEPPPPELAPNCAEAGVLGVLPGVIGTLQAIETIKILLNIGEPLIGRMLHYDALNTQFRELKLRPDPECHYCRPGAPFPGYVDYAAFCATDGGGG